MIHVDAFRIFIGYFPTYLTGAIMAAQLAHYCHQDIPSMDKMIEEGEFDEIREWLKKKVHVGSGTNH